VICIFLNALSPTSKSRYFSLALTGLEHFRKFGKMSPQKQTNQFWKHDNHPFYLHSNEMINQKVNYIHENPVEAGFVNFSHEWRLSSANENSPIKVLEL
jgi:hypothetical protein